ncbi:hypothetical protein LZ554_008932 [Drepanopeziza brunnea f. sp. 'monogermtubi']|nr:hypothetical protein LZ554_008932 [Drepanopeziza brunnea f. sp. 'monogermtubi']
MALCKSSILFHTTPPPAATQPASKFAGMAALRKSSRLSYTAVMSMTKYLSAGLEDAIRGSITAAVLHPKYSRTRRSPSSSFGRFEKPSKAVSVFSAAAGWI